MLNKPGTIDMDDKGTSKEKDNYEHCRVDIPKLYEKRERL